MYRQHLDGDGFRALIDGTKPLSEEDDRVFGTRDDRIIKVFKRRRKHWPRLRRTYAERYLRNAQRLAQLNVPAVRVDTFYDCPQMNSQLLVYPRLPGETLRQIYQNRDIPESVLADLAVFIAGLHARGVYFRALHLGNILSDGHGLALIDVGFMRFKAGSLGIGLRVRNLRHLLSYPLDRSCVAQGLELFCRSYLDNAGLSARRGRDFLRRLNPVLGQFPELQPALQGLRSDLAN